MTGVDTRVGPAATPASDRPVGVLSCGLMGSGIVEVFAASGREVRVHEMDDAAARRGRQRVQASLGRAARSGKITEERCQEVLSRIAFGTGLDGLASCDLVIEAATEDEALKVDLFRRLDKTLVRDEAVLASNTSSIPIRKLGTATARPEQVVGMHLFNPVPVLPLVELVPSMLTSTRTLERVEQVASQELGKTVIRSQDRAGFVVNALLVPYLLSAVRMVEPGFASAADIDAGMMRGCAHPMGPLRLSDLIGLDTLRAIADSMYAEFKEPLFSPPPMLLRTVDAGLLGCKSGGGLYDCSG